MKTRFISSSGAILAVAAVYAVAAKLSFLLTISPGNISPIFPAAGVALAGVMIMGRRALIGVWLGSFAANGLSFFDGSVLSVQTVLSNLLVASFIGFGAMFGAGAGAFLVRRFCKGQSPLQSGRNVLILVTVGALGCCMISPTVGVLALSLERDVPWERFGYSWVTWWVGDAAGTLVAAPLILAWQQRHPFRRSAWRILEATVLGGATLWVCFFVFFRNTPFEYGLLPLLLWAGFRFGMRGASIASAAIAFFAVLGTSRGTSPFVGRTVNESLLLLNSFYGVTITGALFLAGIVEERRRVEKELRESEAKLLAMFNASRDAISVSKEGMQVLANPAFLQLYGYKSLDEILGKPVLTHLAPRCHPEIAERVRRRARGEAVPNFYETRGRRTDGTEFDEEVNVAIYEVQGEKYSVAIIRDITERMRAAAILQESEIRYRFLFEHNPMPMLIYEHDTLQMLAVNEAFIRHYGYSREEALALRLTDLYPEEQKAKIAELITHLRGHAYVGEWRHRKRDGTFITIVASSHDLVYEGKNARVAVTTDVTERKRVEEELRTTQASLERRVLLRTTELAEARDRAEAADRLKSAFLATMSHELRTPLNSIIGFTGIMLQGLTGPLNAEQAKQLGMVQSSARHLLALINDVLDISKIEAGQVEIYAEPFDLRASLEKVTELVRPLAERKGLALRVQLPPTALPVATDRRRVEQVLLNLLNNAVKFTERGEVALGAELVPDFRSGQAHASCPAVCLRVTDTGIGIKPEDLTKLFQPFRQIDSGLTRQHEGTGLGLAICRRLAGLLGGEISVQSAWGKGSAFSFVFPVHYQNKP